MITCCTKKCKYKYFKIITNLNKRLNNNTIKLQHSNSTLTQYSTDKCIYSNCFTMSAIENHILL